VTIAIHLSGAFTLLTATDTQGTYSSGDKVDSGKIMGAWRANPLGGINVAGAGDSNYIKAISQEIVRKFQAFTGNVEELEATVRETAEKFYEKHVFPFVGKAEVVPDYSLLVAATHQGTEKLWNIEGTLLTDSTLYDCIGIGTPTADRLLNRLYPAYPTLDSLAILAAYVIYRVKSDVDGCGLKTEIRFLHQNRPGWVSDECISAWEGLFRRHERVEREIFYHAMNFIVSPTVPTPIAAQLPNSPFELQMRPLPEIAKDAEEIRAEFAKYPVFKR